MIKIELTKEKVWKNMREIIIMLLMLKDHSFFAPSCQFLYFFMEIEKKKLLFSIHVHCTGRCKFCRSMMSFLNRVFFSWHAVGDGVLRIQFIFHVIKSFLL